MNFLPAAYYRGGTSKGVFFNKADLPPEPKLEQILLNILGSPDPYGRQLNGMGGGMSSVSKVVFVEPASEPSIDLSFSAAVAFPNARHAQSCLTRSLWDKA